MTLNGVVLQYFHWDYPDDGRLWRRLEAEARSLKERGVSAVWLPPCYKGADGAVDRGYAVYDLFDLGEFDQKGSVRTRYGTRDQLCSAIRACRDAGLLVYADVVLNHRSGGDEVEEIDAVEVDKDNRNSILGSPQRIKAWTGFSFPGRGGAHSRFQWHAEHFTSVDANAERPDEHKLYLVAGKTFSGEVSFEFANFDHLFGCDVDVYHPSVREELFFWGRWFVDTTQVDGFRLDAVKHIPASFYRDFFNHIRTHFGGRELLGIGEYWSIELPILESYLRDTEGCMKLFDVPLHYRFVAAAEAGSSFDMRTIFDDTLVSRAPLSAVPFVDNHDTQPGAAMASAVQDWFKPLAYALILLRPQGYPCVFLGDLAGGSEEAPHFAGHGHLIDVMLDARRKYLHGDVHDYFDHANCIGWTVTGKAENPGSLAVLLSNGEAGTKRMSTHAPETEYVDLTGHTDHSIRTDAEGWAEFTCPPGSLSIWASR